MPNSTDNQDYKQDEQKEKPVASDKQKETQGDINDFTSDNQKGKKVDADPEKETDKPADV